MAHDIFISHAADPERSRQAAHAIVHELESRGIRCWIAPRDMGAGEDYMGQLSDCVPESKALVLVFSAEANHSPHVKREVGLAFESEVPIIPFRVEDVALDRSLKYCIGQVHWLDALTPPLEDHVRQLADRVEALLAGGSREQIHEIRERKSERRWWRAVVWTMKHGAVAAAMAAIFILGALSMAGWGVNRLLSSSQTISKTVAETLATRERSSSSKPTSPALSANALADKFAKSFHVDENSLTINSVRRFPPEIAKVHFGSSLEALDRFVDVRAELAAEANRTTSHPVHSYPISPATEGIYIQIETADGERSEPTLIRPRRESSRRYGKLIRLALVEAPTGIQDPGAVLASRKTDSELPIFVGAPSGVAELQYAFDEGGLFEESADPRYQGRPQMFRLVVPPNAETVRIRYRFVDGREVGTFRYTLPSLDAIQFDQRQKIMGEKLGELVHCFRILGDAWTNPESGDMWAPPSREVLRGLTEKEIVAMDQRKDLARIKLASARLNRLVRHSGVTVCVPQRGYVKGTTRDVWTAAQAIEIRTDTGTTISTPVSVAGRDSVENVDLTEFWNIELPELAGAVYARLTFVDGTKSDEARVAVEDLNLSKRS